MSVDDEGLQQVCDWLSLLWNVCAIHRHYSHTFFVDFRFSMWSLNFINVSPLFLFRLVFLRRLSYHHYQRFSALSSLHSTVFGDFRCFLNLWFYVMLLFFFGRPKKSRIPKNFLFRLHLHFLMLLWNRLRPLMHRSASNSWNQYQKITRRWSKQLTFKTY